MDLKPIESLEAQDILIKLVEALSPLTQLSKPNFIALNTLPFLPPKRPFDQLPQDSLQKHFVKLLSQLASVEKEVEIFISHTPQIPSKGSVSPTLDSGFPISKQAQKLIHQVQKAIGSLCTSNHIENPQEAAFKETLKLLKPSLERIIASFILAKVTPKAPFSHQESVFKKPPAQSVAKEKEEGKVSSNRAERPIRSITELEKLSREIRTKSVRESITESLTPKATETSFSRPVERTILPGAPYPFDSRGSVETRRKRRRKSFWFCEKDEEKEESQY